MAIGRIFKTKQKATYLEGVFELRDNSSINWADPIDFPTIFTAYGRGIRSGGWQSCTVINTPEYVITHYFNGVNLHSKLFGYADLLSQITWADVELHPEHVKTLIVKANAALKQLPELK